MPAQRTYWVFQKDLAFLGDDSNCECVCCFPVCTALWRGCSTRAQPGNKECTSAPSACTVAALLSTAGLGCCGRGNYTAVLLSHPDSEPWQLISYDSSPEHGPQDILHLLIGAKALIGQWSESRGLPFGGVCLWWQDRSACPVCQFAWSQVHLCNAW